MAEPKNGCTNCGRGPVVARGLDGRCYTYARKHDGQLPPADLLRSPVPLLEIKAFIARETVEVIDGLAAADGPSSSRSVIIRRALDEYIQRQTVGPAPGSRKQE